MIFAIADTYYIAIGIANETNSFLNILNANSEGEVIDCPTHYISWFKFRSPTIRI